MANCFDTADRPEGPRAPAARNATMSPYAALIPAAVLLSDTIAKTLARVRIDPGVVSVLPGPLFLARVPNTGTTFTHAASIEIATWTLVVAVVFAVLAGLVIIRASRNVVTQTAFALLVGGCAANGIDRLVHGHVLDMIGIQLHWGTVVFNIADVALALGVAAGTWALAATPCPRGGGRGT